MYLLIVVVWVVWLMLKLGVSFVMLMYFGLEWVVLNYNMMGVVKVVLEVNVCYLVCDFGL